ncbi:hypothetical protein H6G41_12575 [Tolypothrix sp. FACHB-123]|uniref:hypothetical protein n=1 Tax=Tolypothrix sp. FACHB-123 TaxID=2692868 RepID=UPI001689D46D|nr:hypothetical protein [Tolypothrix sp. FACHB-123]MBD2355438.1 hypothetical protein [Tolypothrix sp. FACHB-123]
MQLNYFTKKLSTVVRWLATTLFCLSAFAFVWQGGFLANTTAMANPVVIASADAGDRIQSKASEDAGRAKNFIRDAADKVEETANKNASKVERATDNDGSFVERKAKRDRATIERRAEEDAARTQKAVDNTKNAVERAVDSVKDAFGK